MRLFSGQTYRTEAIGTQDRYPQLPAQHPSPDAMPVRDCKTEYAEGSVTRQYVDICFLLRGDKMPPLRSGINWREPTGISGMLRWHRQRRSQ